MSEKKKGFRVGVYAVVSGVVIAAILACMTVYAFSTKYTGFKADKIAREYVDTIVQNGDGYNAYKIALVSQNKDLKYGDFIRRAYMAPYKNDGDNVKQASFVGTGSAKEQKAIDTVYNTMYNYYVQLIKTVGWDNYDKFFDSYFARLKEVRHQVYGDDYLDEDYMFGALEANVATYGESLTGTDKQLADDGKTVLKEASVGKYTEIFGKDYKLTTEVKDVKYLSDSEKKTYVSEFKQRIAPIAESGEAKADKFGLVDIKKNKAKKIKKDDPVKSNMIDAFAKLDCSDSIKDVALADVAVKDQKGNVVAELNVYVVKIDNCWYVDNTNIDTSSLYFAK